MRLVMLVYDTDFVSSQPKALISNLKENIKEKEKEVDDIFYVSEEGLYCLKAWGSFTGNYSVKDFIDYLRTPLSY